MSNKLDDIKNNITSSKPGTDELYSGFLPNDNTSDNASIDLTTIPIVKPKLLRELEILCNADKRKSTDELLFISAHMLHDLYLRWTMKHDSNQVRV